MERVTGGGPGWVQERDVLAVLAAIERELEPALAERRFMAARRRLVRLRIMLMAVVHADRPLVEALADLRDALAELLPLA
jgi:hypothetical protein